MMPVNHTNSNDVKTLKRQRDRSRAAFMKGFAEGFGSVGFVCLSGETMSRSALYSALLQASPSDRQAVVAAEIRRKAMRFADHTYFALWSSEDGRSRDSKMIGRDFANAISKLDV